MVFRGTAVVQGNGLAVVTATGMATGMGRIAHLLAATPLKKEVRRIGHMLGRAVLLIALVVVVSVLLTTEIRTLAELQAVLLLGVSLAVAALPEGLPAILSLVLAIGVQRVARRRAIVKQLSSVETLGSASVICTDKTGTLMRSEMTIEKVVTASGTSCPEGVGYEPVGAIRHRGQIVESGPLCHERIAEIPFSSQRRMMSVLVRDREQPGRCLLIAKGAPDLLLQRCSAVQIGSDVVLISYAIRMRVLVDVGKLTDAALRTLAVAYRPLRPQDAQAGAALEQELVFIGTVGIIDPPRPEATAALTGAELDALDDEGLARALRSTSSMRASIRRTSCASSVRCRRRARWSR